MFTELKGLSWAFTVHIVDFRCYSSRHILYLQFSQFYFILTQYDISSFMSCKNLLLLTFISTMCLRIYSYNVKRLNSLRKRWLALKEFCQSHTDVILIKETHFWKGSSFRFALKYYPTVYTASDPLGKAGVAILSKHNCPLQIHSSTLDTLGLLDCQYDKTPITIINVYATNSGQIGFL